MSSKKTLIAAAAAVAWFPRIGQTWPGQGIYVGIMPGEAGAPDYHLFVSADPATQHAAIAWGGQGVDEPGARHEHDGAANTAALVASKTTHPAAEWAAGLRVDGHADWYLPSRRELRLLWCTVPDLMAEGWYWSSTQLSAHDAWYQYFGYGDQLYDVKGSEVRARVVRRFMIT